MKNIELAIAAMLPNIVVPPELSLEEEFALFRNREKPFRVEISNNEVWIYLKFEGLARILMRRLIAKSDQLPFDCDEVFVVLGDRKPMPLYLKCY